MIHGLLVTFFEMPYYPRIIGDFFLNAILERDGCPTLIRTDRALKMVCWPPSNGFLDEMSLTQQSGTNAHRYGSSHSTQHIEA